jgi:hypothetical protein
MHYTVRTGWVTCSTFSLSLHTKYSYVTLLIKWQYSLQAWQPNVGSVLTQFSSHIVFVSQCYITYVSVRTAVKPRWEPSVPNIFQLIQDTTIWRWGWDVFRIWYWGIESCSPSHPLPMQFPPALWRIVYIRKLTWGIFPLIEFSFLSLVSSIRACMNIVGGCGWCGIWGTTNFRLNSIRTSVLKLPVSERIFACTSGWFRPCKNCSDKASSRNYPKLHVRVVANCRNARAYSLKDSVVFLALSRKYFLSTWILRAGLKRADNVVLMAFHVNVAVDKGLLSSRSVEYKDCLHSSKNVRRL